MLRSRILDSVDTPAMVSNMRGDYLAANQLGRARYAPLFESHEQPPNRASCALAALR